MLTVRNLTIADHEGVRTHLARCWRDTYTNLLGGAQVEEMIASLDAVNLGIMVPDGLALIAVETADGSQSMTPTDCVVGTAIAAERGRIGYIWGMYVSADNKRNGIGRAFINEIQQLLPSAQQFSVVVLQVSPDARAFYQALGFSPTAAFDYELAAGLSLPATTMVYGGVHA
jgi:ribosomal protein S18 acetylase RimI-like enzyme